MPSVLDVLLTNCRLDQLAATNLKPRGIFYTGKLQNVLNKKERNLIALKRRANYEDLDCQGTNFRFPNCGDF